MPVAAPYIEIESSSDCLGSDHEMFEDCDSSWDEGFDIVPHSRAQVHQ